MLGGARLRRLAYWPGRKAKLDRPSPCRVRLDGAVGQLADLGDGGAQLGFA